ncbi:MAG: hypothetical protein ACE5GA_05400, partial [Candidatus Zixiibacteriota bacterium]
RMDHIFKDMTMIREAQIYQREPGKILLRIVRAPEFGESDEKKLLQETEKRLGSRIHSEIRYVDRLPRGPGGKLRFVISDIPRAGIREDDS